MWCYINKEEYGKMIKDVIDILSGKDTTVFKVSPKRNGRGIHELRI